MAVLTIIGFDPNNRLNLKKGVPPLSNSVPAAIELGVCIGCDETSSAMVVPEPNGVLNEPPRVSGGLIVQAEPTGHFKPAETYILKFESKDQALAWLRLILPRSALLNKQIFIMEEATDVPPPVASKGAS